MNEHDIKTAFGDTPASFRHQVDQTLMQLEDAPMKRRYKFTTMLAAALCVMMLAGAAFAAAQFGLLALLPFSLPDGAEALVSTNIATLENDYLRVTVEETLYDGQSVAMLLRATPVQPDKYNLQLTGTGEPDDSDGRQTILFTPLVNLHDGDSLVNNLYTMSENFQRSDDGAYLIWGWYDYAKPMGDTLTGELIVTFNSDAIALHESAKMIAPISITSNSNTHTVQILPIGDGVLDGQPFQLISGKITFTEAYGHYEIVTSENREHAIRESYAEYYTLSLFDASGTEYPLQMIQTALQPGDPDTMRTRISVGAMQKIADIPDKLYLQVSLRGQILGQIECAVISAK